jgi:hypothetical protein
MSAGEWTDSWQAVHVGSCHRHILRDRGWGQGSVAARRRCPVRVERQRLDRSGFQHLGVALFLVDWMGWSSSMPVRRARGSVRSARRASGSPAMGKGGTAAMGAPHVCCTHGGSAVGPDDGRILVGVIATSSRKAGQSRCEC